LLLSKQCVINEDNINPGYELGKFFADDNKKLYITSKIDFDNYIIALELHYSDDLQFLQRAVYMLGNNVEYHDIMSD